MPLGIILFLNSMAVYHTSRIIVNYGTRTMECVLASPAHLYMPQLFTHCLPTIICVVLMSIVYLSFLLFSMVPVS